MIAADRPEFSIVIPTYNRPDRLAECLRALAGLHFERRRFEVVVVDDGSAEIEGVRAILADVGRELCGRLVEHDHRGPAAARNLGARIASGRFLAFTDDDCRVDPAWLSELEGHFTRSPRSVAGGSTVNGLVDDVCAEASQALVTYLYQYYERKGTPFIASNNLAMPRNLFDELGGFDERFPLAGGEDREFCDRAHQFGCELTLVRSAVVYHHHALSPRGFVRQHLSYGRGAYRFHRIRAARAGARIRLEPLGFYLGLVHHPLTAGDVRHRLRCCALMVLSQAANAAGFFLERKTSAGSTT